MGPALGRFEVILVEMMRWKRPAEHCEGFISGPWQAMLALLLPRRVIWRQDDVKMGLLASVTFSWGLKVV